LSLILVILVLRSAHLAVVVDRLAPPESD